MKDFLDEIDVQILRTLQTDGRITNADLAEKVGLSPPSTLQRVRRLEKAGLIRGYAALLDPDRLGFKVTVFASVRLELHQDQPVERFRREVMSIPEVLECYNVSGEADFLLKIIVADIKAYEALVREKLSRIRGIGQIQSSFVLATTKHTTRLPV